jgi:hypothetical protein
MEQKRQTHGSGRPAGARTAALLLLGSLAGCGGGSGTPGDPVGEWLGTLRTEKGTCPDRTPSRLQVEDGKVLFTPADGVLVLQGRRKPDSDRLHAQLQLSDMNHHPLPMVFEGALRPDGTAIDGTYGTPSCRAQVTLVRPAANSLSHALGH